MKDIVFTEFLNLVEASHGTDMVEDVTDEAAPANGSAYTTVGNYPSTKFCKRWSDFPNIWIMKVAVNIF